MSCTIGAVPEKHGIRRTRLAHVLREYGTIRFGMDAVHREDSIPVPKNGGGRKAGKSQPPLIWIDDSSEQDSPH